MTKYIGQRIWYNNGEVFTCPTNKWINLPEDGLLVRMLYSEEGAKEIQQGLDFYYEAPHHSGEIIRGAGMILDDIKNRYPEASIKRGIWSPKEYYNNIVVIAMSSTWENYDN